MRLYLSSFGLGNQPQELLSLVRGKRAAVVLNAKDGSSPERRAASLETELTNLSGLGLDPFELDLRDHFEVSESLARTLKGVNLIWVRGGNVFVLRQAFRRSGLDRLLPDLLSRDALVYGGFSAAACVLPKSLRGLEMVDSTEVVPEGYEPQPIWDGLGLIPFSVAPHYRCDHPESASIDGLVQFYIDHHEPFIALADGEAIVLNGADLRVVS